jgi:hypothetical protein
MRLSAHEPSQRRLMASAKLGCDVRSWMVLRQVLQRRNVVCRPARKGGLDSCHTHLNHGPDDETGKERFQWTGGGPVREDFLVRPMGKFGRICRTLFQPVSRCIILSQQRYDCYSHHAVSSAL